MEIGKHLQEISQKVQVQHVLNEPKTGDAIDFEIVIQGDKIHDSPAEKLKQVLRLVMVKIGLRAINWPSDEEKILLVQHIIQHYGGHTPAEILLAFDMAIAGKLEVEVNCYENFSCLYVSNIMNTYRAWAKEQHKQIKPIMLEEKVSQITNQDWWNETKTQVRNRKLTVEFVPLDLYEWAIKEELINPTKADKWRYLGMAVEYRQAVLYANVSMDSTRENNTIFSEFMRMKNAGAFEGEEKVKLISLSKKMILFDVYLNDKNDK